MTAGSANQVDTNVWISGYLIAADPKFIQREGISRIVKLFADSHDYPGGYHRHPGVKYLIVAAEDTPDYDIRPAAMAAVRFIREGIANGERILVQCHAGVSRSATVVLFHLMLNRNYDLDHAYARLKMARGVIHPNVGFMEHLRATGARIEQLRVGDEHMSETQFYIAPRPILAYEAADACEGAGTTYSGPYDCGKGMPVLEEHMTARSGESGCLAPGGHSAPDILAGDSLNDAAFSLRFARRGRYYDSRRMERPERVRAQPAASESEPGSEFPWAFAGPQAHAPRARSEHAADSVSL